jgi:hypothetical protein
MIEYCSVSSSATSQSCSSGFYFQLASDVEESEGYPSRRSVTVKNCRAQRARQVQQGGFTSGRRRTRWKRALLPGIAPENLKLMLHCSVTRYISRFCDNRQRKNLRITHAYYAYGTSRLLESPAHPTGFCQRGTERTTAPSRGSLAFARAIRWRLAHPRTSSRAENRLDGAPRQLVSSSTLRRMNWRNSVMRLECRSSSG